VSDDPHPAQTDPDDLDLDLALDLPGAVEALLLVTDQPVSTALLARVLERPEPDVDAVLERLAADYAARGSGIQVSNVAGGWRLYTAPEHAVHVERYLLDGQQARLTQAALETLAVIAYRQPVSRSRVSAVRGVNVDGVVRTLVARGLVTECGNDEVSGAALYATTELFLERLGITSLDDLPALAPLLPDLSELDDSTSA
jgi:segregation and condensation protein B